MRGNRTPSYPALPECSAVKTSMVAPKFNACREADVETLPVALHRSPWSLGRSTPIHHATPFQLLREARSGSICTSGWLESNQRSPVSKTGRLPLSHSPRDDFYLTVSGKERKRPTHREDREPRFTRRLYHRLTYRSSRASQSLELPFAQ